MRRLAARVRSRSRSSWASTATEPATNTNAAAAKRRCHDPPTTPSSTLIVREPNRRNGSTPDYNRLHMRQRGSVAEIICFVLLLAYLVWVPLPFGSASDDALTPLVVPPLLLGAAAAIGAARSP